jgi:biotin carboxylase
MAARVLVLCSTTSYRTDDFARAAARLGVEAVLGTDRCHMLAEIWPREAFGGSLPLEFRHEAEAAQAIVAEARARPLDAIIATDEPTADIAARAAAALGLPGNSVGAARTARNKRLMRMALRDGGVSSPRFDVFEEEDDPRRFAESVASTVGYPLVVKPLLCSTSRGVIRANSPAEMVQAWQRVVALLRTPALRAVEDPDGHRLLLESFVPGPEVALEGVLTRGRLRVLALFDKPDPLDGPFFEETIYVTPSRHPPELQAAIADTAARAAAAMGLKEGPVHAELRLPPSGMPVVIEVAARSIGGLCSRTLRFGLGETSLEEVVIRHALGQELGALESAGAAGVMMIPIPAAGVLQEVRGIDQALAVPLIEDLQMTARAGQVLVPFPEGNAYPGFIFARGETPDAVEEALRQAHRRLELVIAPTLSTKS